MSQVPVITLEHVSFSFGAAPVLEDVTLAVEAGDFLWVVGPNGGGKTTLVRLILGLLQPDSGRIRVFGRRPKQALGRIGYMPQSAEIDARFPVSAGDVVLMGRLGSGRVFGAYSRQDKEAAARALGAVGLSEERNRHFKEVNQGLKRKQAVAEAQRCLDCANPQCVMGCPVGIDIPYFIKLIEVGRHADAARKLVIELRGCEVLEDAALDESACEVCLEELLQPTSEVAHFEVNQCARRYGRRQFEFVLSR